MKRAIGILGGMGPEASGYLYNILIEKSINEFKAVHNEDFPEIVLYSLPIPDFISDESGKKRALLMLQKSTEKLNKMGVSTICLACNTAHSLLDELRANSEAPFTSMIDEVADVIKADKRRRVGILASPSTLRTKLYQEPLNKRGIIALEPSLEDLVELEKIIRKVISGTFGKKESESLLYIANKLTDGGSEAIVLGCTELPLIFPKNYRVPIYDSVEVLADALLRNYYK